MKSAAPVSAPAPVMMRSARPAKDVPAAPSVRRFARELGLDVSVVPGSGRGGRITNEDIKAYVKAIMTSGGMMMGIPQAPAAKPLPDFSKWGAVERQPMSKIRSVTAEHLSYCWQTIPHVTQFGKADITELEKLRKQSSTTEHKLTITPFLLKIMAAAMKQFPQFSASINMETKEIIYKKYIHIGVAVDTDHGLLVPVIRNVDQKSIMQIHEEVTTLAQKARDRKISLDELKGGCMSLTNLGGIGGTAFTPIVNWPEVAILGVSRGAMEQVYNGKEFVARMMLPLSLSYDHRLIDGADGARFLRWVCEAIEKPGLIQ
jgi:pyruvate dehydrogenase E2 component (dihydrolipoamide acetyltransferase)